MTSPKESSETSKANLESESDTLSQLHDSLTQSNMKPTSKELNKQKNKQIKKQSEDVISMMLKKDSDL